MATHNDKERIIDLSRFYDDDNYKFYPNRCDGKSNLKKIMNSIPDYYQKYYYFEEIKEFLKVQTDRNVNKGPDLPFWGKNYFTISNRPKILILSQDSHSEYSCSVVFYACLFELICNKKEFEIFRKKVSISDFVAYDLVRNYFIEMFDRNLDTIFLTDAYKFFKINKKGIEIRDTKRSRELLQKEIVVLEPDIIITLGCLSWDLIKPIYKNHKKYSACVSKILSLENPFLNKIHHIVVSPFPGYRRIDFFNLYREKTIKNVKDSINRY